MREVRAHPLDRPGARRDEIGKATGRDHARLAPDRRECARRPAHLAGEPVDKPGPQRLGRSSRSRPTVMNSTSSEAACVKSASIRSRCPWRARRHVLACPPRHVEVRGRPESTTMQGAPKCSFAATELTMRSGPTSCGASWRRAIWVRTPGPTTSSGFSRQRSANCSYSRIKERTVEERQTPATQCRDRRGRLSASRARPRCASGRSPRATARSGDRRRRARRPSACYRSRRRAATRFRRRCAGTRRFARRAPRRSASALRPRGSALPR